MVVGYGHERTATEVRWRNATLRDFIAALWMSSRATECERDAFHRRMDVARDVRDSSIAATWQMICGMPPDVVRLCSGANDTQRNLPWLRMVHPLYQTGDKEKRFHGRPTELMYRTWPGLLYRAGFLGSLAWTEYDLLIATTIAQQYFDRKTKSATPESVSIKDDNAWKIMGGFLQQYPVLRDADDERSRIIREDLEGHWCDCKSRASMPVRVGHAKQSDNVERVEVLPHEFAMCAYQVTNRLLHIFDPSHFNSEEENTLSEEEQLFAGQRDGGTVFKMSYFSKEAATNLNWYDAMMLCIWCHGYLPSEWEWEYASRADTRTAEGTNAVFYWGDEAGHHTTFVQAVLAYSSEYNNTYRPQKMTVEDVGCRHANSFGLHDSLGNVWEWCRNRFSTERKAWGVRGPNGPQTFVDRVRRGASFRSWIEEAGCSIRSKRHPSDRNSDCGCRISKVRSN